MSDSVRPQRRQPTRLPRPWDSPGENPGVGCHFLLQCMKVKSESEVAQSYLTLSDPMDCSPPGSSVHRILQARTLEWGATAFSPTIAYSQRQPVFMKNLATSEPSPRGAAGPEDILCVQDLVEKGSPASVRGSPGVVRVRIHGEWPCAGACARGHVCVPG